MESTRTTKATWTAPSCGIFYITVVAYDEAQQRSDVVCSDDVETCKPSPVQSSSLIGRNLVLVVSATASAVVAVAGIVVGVVVWRRKRRGQPKFSDQTVYYNTGPSENAKPKKTKPEDTMYDKLDVNARDGGAGQEPYCSIQTCRSDKTNIYEAVENQMYLNIGERPRVTLNSKSSDIYEKI
ncbi:uncharacterized protein LOC124261761 [Haliotis rubra]|uniref:uncharacterized protein LOC124261761 n=1 Tax=Haliotis rubra TaxID=36100 RepID=UPI001EE61824|nr:uncharacterized protein LOC124261761 [Haliotis rubra]